MVKRILIVDDDPGIVNLLRLLLEERGYEIFIARDGREALELLETQQVELILADVAMPHLNGYELCQRVKNSPNPQLVLTPVILMSGRTLDSDIRYGKSLGADDYLAKPFDIEDLLAVVQGKLLAAERVSVSVPTANRRPADCYFDHQSASGASRLPATLGLGPRRFITRMAASTWVASVRCWPRALTSPRLRHCSSSLSNKRISA
jgi:DNA-binding response OmpR family regulator